MGSHWDIQGMNYIIGLLTLMVLGSAALGLAVLVGYLVHLGWRLAGGG